MLRWYQLKLAQRPLLTQSITTAILFATGDCMAQQIVEKKGPKNHEWDRTARMASYGGLVFGPAATTWFKVLQRIQLRSTNGTILARVACDQFLFAPTNMCVFLSTMAVLEGGKPQDKLNTTYWPALTKNWMVWPWIQMANFKFVPLEHRVLLVNVISLGWNCYLSFLNSQGGAPAAGSEGGALAADKHDKHD